MIKWFHLWFRPVDDCTKPNILNTVHEVEDALNKDIPYIHTYQVCTLKGYIFELGYHIMIHPYEGEDFELTLGECKNTDREIRITHNLAKMLLNKVFDTNDTNVTGLD